MLKSGLPKEMEEGPSAPTTVQSELEGNQPKEVKKHGSDGDGTPSPKRLSTEAVRLSVSSARLKISFPVPGSSAPPPRTALPRDAKFKNDSAVYRYLVGEFSGYYSLRSVKEMEENIETYCQYLQAIIEDQVRPGFPTGCTSAAVKFILSFLESGILMLCPNLMNTTISGKTVFDIVGMISTDQLLSYADDCGRNGYPVREVATFFGALMDLPKKQQELSSKIISLLAKDEAVSLDFLTSSVGYQAQSFSSDDLVVSKKIVGAIAQQVLDKKQGKPDQAVSLQLDTNRIFLSAVEAGNLAFLRKAINHMQFNPLDCVDEAGNNMLHRIARSPTAKNYLVSRELIRSYSGLLKLENTGGLTPFAAAEQKLADLIDSYNGCSQTEVSLRKQLKLLDDNKEAGSPGRSLRRRFATTLSESFFGKSAAAECAGSEVLVLGGMIDALKKKSYSDKKKKTVDEVIFFLAIVQECVSLMKKCNDKQSLITQHAAAIEEHKKSATHFKCMA